MADQARGEAVLLTAAALAGTLAARKVVDVIWVSATGRHTPRADDPNEDLTAAAIAAVLTGAMVALVRMGVARKANQLKSRRRASA
jgi:hypothetical protein